MGFAKFVMDIFAIFRSTTINAASVNCAVKSEVARLIR